MAFTSRACELTDNMLQQRIVSEEAARAITRARGELGTASSSIDDELLRFRGARRVAALERGRVAHLVDRWDSAIRTNAIEYLDRPEYPETKKLRIALGVHLMNLATASYGRFLAVLEPMLRQIAEREQRPARLLELASGCGGFALALATRAERRGLPVQVTGSDVVPLYVDRANEAARVGRVAATFRRLDALDMHDVEPGAYDVVFVAQSMHHFTAGQLGAMIAQSQRAARTAFVGIDGFRSLFMLGFVTAGSMLSLQPDVVHDAVITARKFYAESELALIARAACPLAHVTTRRLFPFNSLLTVRFA